MGNSQEKKTKKSRKRTYRRRTSKPRMTRITRAKNTLQKKEIAQDIPESTEEVSGSLPEVAFMKKGEEPKENLETNQDAEHVLEVNFEEMPKESLNETGYDIDLQDVKSNKIGFDDSKEVTFKETGNDPKSLERDYDNYVDKVIGSFTSDLGNIYFNDETKASYLDVLKWNASLLWDEQHQRQIDMGDPDEVRINIDVLESLLLSLHPDDKIEDANVSENAEKALRSLHDFRPLFMLELNADDLDKLVVAGMGIIQEVNHPFMESCMFWFLSLVSKLSGVAIPGKEMPPGGKVRMEEELARKYVRGMRMLSGAMMKRFHWNYLAQYAMLKQKYQTLKQMEEAMN